MGLHYFAIASTENLSSVHDLVLNRVAESLLLQIAFFLKIGIECCALLILSMGICKAIVKLLAVRKRRESSPNLGSVRLELGLSLALSLEFLLAADIAATAVSPSWDTIGKLAAISGIRTFLNFFLQQEIQELEKRK